MHCSNIRRNAYSSNIVHLSDALAANLVHVEAILHVRDASLCIIINTD